MKYIKYVAVFLALLLVLQFTPRPTEVYAQLGEYLFSLYARNFIQLLPDASTSTQSAEVYFFDTDMKVYASVDGQLDVVADTEVEITTPTFDVVGDSMTIGTGFWASAPSSAINTLPFAFFYLEDFIGTPVDTNATGDNVPRGWKTASDDGTIFASAAGTLGGIANITAATGSNNEAYFQLGELGTETYVEFTGSSGLKTWVEYRVADTDITSSAGNFFIGLAEEGSAAANFIADAGDDIADKDVVGFVQWEANDDTVQVLYQTAGGVFCDTFQTRIDTTGFKTYGIYFDGATTVSFYIDGTSVGTIATTTTLFPDGEELAPLFGVKQGAQDRQINIDWIKIVSER